MSETRQAKVAGQVIQGEGLSRAEDLWREEVWFSEELRMKARVDGERWGGYAEAGGRSGWDSAGLNGPY